MRERKYALLHLEVSFRWVYIKEVFVNGVKLKENLEGLILQSSKVLCGLQTFYFSHYNMGIIIREIIAGLFNGYIHFLDVWFIELKGTCKFNIKHEFGFTLDEFG